MGNLGDGSVFPRSTDAGARIGIDVSVAMIGLHCTSLHLKIIIKHGSVTSQPDTAAPPTDPGVCVCHTRAFVCIIDPFFSLKCPATPRAAPSQITSRSCTGFLFGSGCHDNSAFLFQAPFLKSVVQERWRSELQQRYVRGGPGHGGGFLPHCKA